MMRYFLMHLCLAGLSAHAANSDRRAALPSLHPNVKIDFCEGSLALGHESILVIGASELLDAKIQNGEIRNQGQLDAFGADQYEAERFEKVDAFARNAVLDGSVDLPPGMRLNILGSFGAQAAIFEILTASLDEQNAALKDLIGAGSFGPEASVGAVTFVTVRRSGEIEIYPTLDGRLDAAQLKRLRTGGTYREVLALRPSNYVLPFEFDYLTIEVLREILRERGDIILPIHVPVQPERRTLIVFNHIELLG